MEGSMARFDVKRVNPLEWAGIAAAVVGVLVLRAPWFTPTARDVWIAGRYGIEPDPSGWQVGVLARTGVSLLVVAALVVLLPHLGIRVRWRPGIWIVAALAALVLVGISRHQYGTGETEGGYTPDVSLWFYAAAAATWVSLAAAALNARLAPKPERPRPGR
jgi:hypothetical protein